MTIFVINNGNFVIWRRIQRVQIFGQRLGVQIFGQRLESKNYTILLQWDILISPYTYPASKFWIKHQISFNRISISAYSFFYEDNAFCFNLCTFIQIIFCVRKNLLKTVPRGFRKKKQTRPIISIIFHGKRTEKRGKKKLLGQAQTLFVAVF